MISIIVTAYKTEAYLKRCIESILAQEEKFFELILVDNASPDNCGKIIESFALKDSRIRPIYLKENLGPGNGRNCGLEASSGDYICFVDSDDTVKKNYLSFLLKALLVNNADMAWCNADYIRCGESTAHIGLSRYDLTLEGKEKLLAYISDKAAPLAPWGKLYKKELFCNFRYALGPLDDGPVQYKLFVLANRIAYVACPLYNYYIYSDSTTHTMNENAIYRQVAMTQGFYDAYKYSTTIYSELSSAMYTTYVKALCGSYKISKIYNFENGNRKKSDEIKIWNELLNINKWLLDIRLFPTLPNKMIYYSLKYCKPLIGLYYTIYAKTGKRMR